MFAYAMDTIVSSDFQGNDDESPGVRRLPVSYILRLLDLV